MSGVAEARRQIGVCIRAIREAMYAVDPAIEGRALAEALGAAVCVGLELDDVLEVSGADTLPMPPESAVKEVSR